ncbi:ABC transporter ATP-binding protein [Thalassorhabdomicrobium marinisediminis]|uniref:ABC transporter ATP-binding protein n=1 Tax=Thalassorhabdomicrobium marinisediminis TaxID=2170577 RepID=A0A2T7FSR6_9RHOB|nr:ABC transporter ATP-binding protein [Thalassorhabdomicrobium marinisediminis]PVA05216.1 ABC transporter ATP-binding protein [Thalassorhabdomicrobium marinisediminis]
MISLEHVSKHFYMRGYRKTVLKNVNATFPSGKAVALLGRNGAGKSTLMKLIAGTVNPSAGRVKISGTVSWPVGFAGSFHPELTGAQNTRFLARIYGTDADELVDFVADFSELGRSFHQRFGGYSSGMKSRLAFGASMGIDFDTYLVDEVTAVGDQAFKQKSQALFKTRMRQSGAIVVSHSMPQIRDMCDAGAVLEGGNIVYYNDIESAIAHHLHNMNVTPATN